ncbi:MAG: hypothetical protein ACWA5P_01840 [bacterium]
MTFKEKRELLSKIPESSFYCYTPLTAFHKMEDGKYGFKIKTCPFYEYVDGLLDKCSLCNTEVIDQTKSCGRRYPSLKNSL